MISARLRKARLMAGLTQKSLAGIIGVPPRLISRFESGQVTPSSFQLLQLAKACGVRTEYFFWRDTVTLIDTRWFTGIGESE